MSWEAYGRCGPYDAGVEAALASWLAKEEAPAAKVATGARNTMALHSNCV